MPWQPNEPKKCADAPTVHWGTKCDKCGRNHQWIRHIYRKAKGFIYGVKKEPCQGGFSCNRFGYRKHRGKVHCCFCGGVLTLKQMDEVHRWWKDCERCGRATWSCKCQEGFLDTDLPSLVAVGIKEAKHD